MDRLAQRRFEGLLVGVRVVGALFAAGIFQSNLGGGEQRAYNAHANQEAFEAALGKTIHDPFALYQQAQDASIAALKA